MDKDILIIGGGPSGLSTALHLQQIAPELVKRVLILEKEHYPRPKLCAGGLVSDAEVLLQKLGLDVSEIPHTDSFGTHIGFAGKGLTIRLPANQYNLRIIRRDEFDAWLAGKAQERCIEIRSGVTVLSIVADDSGVSVETDQGSFRAKAVVGADGSNGITRRCTLRQPHEPINTARLLEVLTPAGIQNDHAEADAYFDFFPVPSGIAGYTWDFPTQVKGVPMRCWGIYDANILADGKRAGLKEMLSAEMKRMDLNLEDYELKGHPIHWFDPLTRLNASRVLLVGDAAGTDLLFGEGISMALAYGKLAARELKYAMEQDDYSFKNYRTRVRLSPMGQTLTARWMIANIIYTFSWKWFQILLWWVLKPVVLLVAWIFVLNWAKRMPDS